MMRRVRETWGWVLAKPTGRWLVLGGLTGMATGAAGAVFQVATDALARTVLGRLGGIDPELVTQPGSGGDAGTDAWPWLLPLLMAAGGLAAGLVCERFARAARGGGTGVAVQAFHGHRGRLPVRLTLTKFLASVLTLGSGGSGGREGPITLVGAGLGSLLAERLRLTAHDRRVLLVAGIAGGIAAVFRAPLTAAIYAIEVLYRGPDLETDALIPCFIAAATSYVSGTIGLDLLEPLIGGSPSFASTLFQPPVLAFHPADWMQLVGYTAVAGTSVLAAWIYAGCMRLVRAAAERSRLPAWSTPAVGAGLAGVVGLLAVGAARLAVHEPGTAELALATVGSGYGALHWLFSGGGSSLAPILLAIVLAALAVCRALATALTVGSGGSGGLFGPALVIGGCAGGAMGALLSGTPVAAPLAACVLMGMAAVLSATHRTPVAALLMVGEIAGTWLLLLPAMWVSGLAFLLGRQTSVVGGQAEDPASSSAHRSHHFADPLSRAQVKDLLSQQRPWTLIRPDQTLPDIRLALQGAEHDSLPVVDGGGRFLGVIDRGDVVGMSADPALDGQRRAVDLAAGAGAALRPGDPLDQALRRLHAQQLDEMPVVDEQGRYLGMVGLAQLAVHYRNAVEGIERDRQSEHSLDAEMAAHPRGSTAEQQAGADALAD